MDGLFRKFRHLLSEISDNLFLLGWKVFNDQVFRWSFFWADLWWRIESILCRIVWAWTSDLKKSRLFCGFEDIGADIFANIFSGGCWTLRQTSLDVNEAITMFQLSTNNEEKAVILDLHQKIFKLLFYVIIQKQFTCSKWKKAWNFNN